MMRIIFFWVFGLIAINSYSWNAIGHKVVAQIAYDNLSPDAKIMTHKYLRASKNRSSSPSFVVSSIWMDQIRTKKIYWYDTLHYIDIPFSVDGTNNPIVDNKNAVWAIQNAVVILKAKNTNKEDKQLALRMLIHIVGDLHQPLHTITRVSKHNPKGDLGGNLFSLGENPIGTNLHQYWDNGAGLFKRKYRENQIKNMASQLEKEYPCRDIAQKNPSNWAMSAHNLARKYSYQINPNSIPSYRYQMNSQALVKKQVSAAGCRLAYLLNNIAQTNIDA